MSPSNEPTAAATSSTTTTSATTSSPLASITALGNVLRLDQGWHRARARRNLCPPRRRRERAAPPLSLEAGPDVFVITSTLGLGAGTPYCKYLVSHPDIAARRNFCSVAPGCIKATQSFAEHGIKEKATQRHLKPTVAVVQPHAPLSAADLHGDFTSRPVAEWPPSLSIGLLAIHTSNFNCLGTTRGNVLLAVAPKAGFELEAQHALRALTSDVFAASNDPSSPHRLFAKVNELVAASGARPRLGVPDAAPRVERGLRCAKCDVEMQTKDMPAGDHALRDAIARRALQPSLLRCVGHSVAGTGSVLCVSLSPPQHYFGCSCRLPP